MTRLRPLSLRARLTLWYTAVLMAILLIISGLSYSLLRSRLIQDLDASLLVMGQVILDRGHPGSPGTLAAGPESLLGEILGPEFYDKVFTVSMCDDSAMLNCRRWDDRDCLFIHALTRIM